MSDAILDVRGVSISLGGLQILNDVSMRAERGKITGVIGPNGAGKTTLFNIVSGFMAPTAGRVLFNGMDLIGRTPEHIAGDGLVRTFQKVRGLPDMSVRDNVLLGALARHSRPSAAQATVTELLDRLSLTPYADAVAASLPIGLRKMLEVARVLATRPQLVLLDEVMGGLVPSEVEDMMAVIRSITEQDGTSVILIEHHMRAVMGLSDHVVVLERGQNLASGNPRDVTRDPAVLTAYLGKGFVHAES